MPVNFNENALNIFRNAHFANENAVANLDGKDGLKTNGTYRGPLGKLFRLGASKDANNAVRTELLKALGTAFGLEGMSDVNGKVTFTKDFMDKLESLLGAAFKRDDFGVGPNGGAVISGKPLTARRITAIMQQAKIVGKTEFSIPVYEEKLAAIQDKLKAMPQDRLTERAISHFNGVKKVLEFLKTEAATLVKQNETYAYYVELNEEEEAIDKGLSKWDMHDASKGKDVPLENDSIGPVIRYLQSRVGQLLHLELNANKPELVNAYVKHEMESFAKLSIDLFNDSFQAGKLDLYMQRLDDPGACLEAQTKNLLEFQAKHDLAEKEPEPVGAPKTISLDKVANHDKTMKVHDCIMLEMGAIDAAHPGEEFDKWEDYADEIKKALVGVERPLVEAKKNNKGLWDFEPVLDNNGNQVVKKLTAEDIDKLGPACVEYLTIY